MFDTHIHTNNSHDCKQTIEQVCISAIEKGVKGISITDHIDTYAYDDEHNFGVIDGSISDVEYAKKAFGSKLKIFKGIEIGQYHFNTDTSKKYCTRSDFDIILGSVHSFPLNGKKIHISGDDLSEQAVPIDVLTTWMSAYFDELLKTAAYADIDVLCHLTYPLRYTNGKYKRNPDMNIFKSKITDILKTIIKRNIALEINTAQLGSDFNFTAPTFDIVKDYFDMGGRLITLASDAHNPTGITNGFDTAAKELTKTGFCEYYYFEKRKPVAVELT